MRRYDENLLERLYSYVMEYQRDTGSSPTYRKIVRKFPKNFSSTSKIFNYLKVLQKREQIDLNMDGSIAVDYRFQTEGIQVPLVGVVACGQPIEAIENIEASYSLPSELFGSGKLMLLKADGQSMQNIGIDTGDLIVIRRQNHADYGDKVLAIIGDSATVKTYYPKGVGRIILHSENDNFKDIIVQNCEIQGIVVGCIKTYGSY